MAAAFASEPTPEDMEKAAEAVRYSKITKIKEFHVGTFDLSDPKEFAERFGFTPIEDRLAAYDACFFCLGVSSAGMTEQAYRRLTYDLTLSVARVLVRLNPTMTFIYVSGAGTDSTERGRLMWARVKGATENSLLGMFKSAYMFRPAYIQPLHGIRTKTVLYRAFYAILAPLYPLWKLLLPKYVTTTECVGRAMILVALRGAPKRVLESQDIAAACRP